MSWFKENISLLVGIFAIVSGISGQYYVSEKLSDKLEVIVNEIKDMHTQSILMSDRFTKRDNIASLDGYIKNTLGRDAILRGLAVNSPLRTTPEGELLLEELGIDDMILKIKVRKGDASIKHVLISILSTVHIQRELLKYSKEHEGEESIYTPEDLTAVLGAATAFYNSIK